MRISGSLTFLDASVGGYNLENNDRMNIVESAKQTTCSTAEILNIKCGSAARVERATCIARTAQVLCIEGLDWFITPERYAIHFYVRKRTGFFANASPLTNFITGTDCDRFYQKSKV